MGHPSPDLVTLSFVQVPSERPQEFCFAPPRDLFPTREEADITDYGSLVVQLSDALGKIRSSRLKEIVREREEADDLFKISYCLLVLSQNKRVKTSTNSSSDHNGAFGFAISHSIHKDIFKLKLQVEKVKDDVWNLSAKLGKIQQELALLSVQVETIAHQINLMSKDCAKMVKAQLMVSLGGKGNRCHYQTVQTPLKRCREGNGRSPIEADWITETVDALLVALTGKGQEILKWKDISCLAPRKMVDNYVVDYIALVVSKNCDEV
ncbi:hypothetical protein ACLB2K_032151 [Fragaria x ananassa]